MIKVFILSIIIIFSACAPQRVAYIPQPKEASRYSVSPKTSQGSPYVVKKGDSLWGISKQYGVSVSTLMRHNDISSPQDLKVGQVISVPRGYAKSGDNYFSWPLKGEVVNFFGERVNNVTNRGVDIKINGDTYVKASKSGEVVYYDSLKGWGPTLILRHPDNFYTIYANLINNTVNDGDYVEKNEVVGEVSSVKSGNQILHFEVRKKHLPQDPMKYLR
jgi:lipoprotein YgeR